MIDVLTYATNAILLVTLVYCIVLERRIRAFRQQETVFRGLISEVTRATLAAQTAVSHLRAALNDADRATFEQSNLGRQSLERSSAESGARRARHEPMIVSTHPDSTPKMPKARTDLSDLAHRVAEMRLAGAQSR